MMAKKLSYILLLIWISSKVFAGETDTLKFYSKFLNEEREIIILKPDSFNISDSVLVMIMLDGERSVSRYNSLYSQNPSVKILGIGIVNTNRNRDLLAIKKADTFLNFISEELLPLINESYNVKNSILYGHSFAGGFTIYSMINIPELFDTYIASSPTPIMNFVDPEIYGKIDLALDKEIAFYFSYGSKDLRQVKKWNTKLEESLSSLEFKNILWKHEVHPGKNHSSSSRSALINGVNYYF
jgi:predicted alpha/beta superfamily hydrolase